MGLGLALDFLPRPTGLLRRRASAEALARALLAEAVSAWPLLDGFARVEARERGWWVRLVPCEEDVQVEQAENRVRFSARTSTCGPGYHAFLVGLLDRVAQRDGGVWHDAGAGDETTLLDESGYFEERNFERLQQSMSGWLRALGSSVAGGEIGEGSRICMPVDLPDTLEPGLLTPSGVRPRDFFMQLARLEGKALAQAASEWFAWWDEGTQAAPQGLARAMLFQLPWRVPESDTEKTEVRIALTLVESVPPNTRFAGDTATDCAAELRELLLPGAADRAPRSHGFGYRRGEVAFRPFEGCKIRLPGYWHESREDEGATALYWHGGKTVRVSTSRVQDSGEPVPASAILRAAQAGRPAAPVRTFEWSGDPAPGVGWVVRTEEEGQAYFLMLACKAVEGRLMHMTIAYLSESDHEWAERAVAGARIHD